MEHRLCRDNYGVLSQIWEDCSGDSTPVQSTSRENILLKKWIGLRQSTTSNRFTLLDIQWEVWSLGTISRYHGGDKRVKKPRYTGHSPSGDSYSTDGFAPMWGKCCRAAQVKCSPNLLFYASSEQMDSLLTSP